MILRYDKLAILGVALLILVLLVARFTLGEEKFFRVMLGHPCLVEGNCSDR